MFDQAMEAIADDIGKKVGEMERFMEISDSFMQGIDLQNGVFEEQGLDMLNKWEQEGTSFLLGKEKQAIINSVEKSSVPIDLDVPIQKSTKDERGGKTQYSDMFDF